MELHAHVPKIGKTSGHWLLEGVFIVISVALGFWVAQVREERQRQWSNSNTTSDSFCFRFIANTCRSLPPQWATADARNET
jgi:hypothetical protein